MKHYGDVTKINGGAVETVDIITGGSPCQDLSVAGKRAGLDGERSGLFMEQVRIVKEMREHDVRTNGRTGQFIRPRYMVFENVPGLFSSNGGKDFQAVLTEIARIAEPECPDVPMPEKNKWRKSGCIYDGMGQWSIAWRVHDAQFWGVPQRRKRIALVADFGGLTAPEILFERKVLSRDIEPGAEARETTAGATADRAGNAICLQGNGIDRADTAGCNGRGWNDEDVSYTLNTIDRPAVCAGFKSGAGDKAGGIWYQEECSPTLASSDSGTNRTPVVCDARGNGYGSVVPTITGDNQRRTTDYTALFVGNGQMRNMSMAPIANSLDCMHDQQAVYIPEVANALARRYDGSPQPDKGNGANIVCCPDVAHALKAKANLQFREDSETYIVAVDCRNATENADTNGTLQVKSNGGVSYNLQNVCRTGSVVRRLTPKECERLQGFPDGWTDIGEWTDSKGKRHKDADSPRYKALGNSIALPFWAWLARRICAQYERPMTMASLFDGIGGFPLVFSRAGCTPVWASEIEEFPIAVTKKRFPEV